MFQIVTSGFFFSNLHPLDVLSVCERDPVFAVSAEGRGLGYVPDVCTNIPSQKAKFIVHIILIQGEM